MFPRLEKILKPLEEYLINNTDKAIKPPAFGEDPYLVSQFQTDYVENNLVSTFSIDADGRPMKVYQLSGNPQDKTNKKAFIHITGSTGYVAKNLVELELVIRALNNGSQFPIDAFFLDYRGGGFNQECAEESIAQYSLERDAKDQAALIKALIARGYEPQNILIHTQSYGSAVALRALCDLIKKEGLDFAKIKLFCDRGYGNFVDFPLMDILFSHLKSKKMLDGKHKAINSSLDETYSVDSKTCSYETLRFSALPIQEYHLMLALLQEQPIYLQYTFDFPRQENNDPIRNYFIKDTVFSLPPIVYNGKKSEPAADKVNAVVDLTSIFKELHEYCVGHIKRALSSNLGTEYKNNYLPFFGVKLGKQLNSAIKIMTVLANGPDWKTILAMKNQKDAHASGDLANIFKKIYNMAEELKLLEGFNKQIKDIHPKVIISKAQRL